MKNRFMLMMALLLMVQISFAAEPEWIPTAVAAIMLSICILAIIYMIGTGFDINEMKILAHEEIYQVIATAFMISVFFAASAFVNEISDMLVPDITGTLQVKSALTVMSYIQHQETIMTNLRSFAITLGAESSKSSFCSLHGIGYSIAACNSFRALTSPLTMALQAISLSISELSSLLALLVFGNKYALSLLLPLGILLRTFRFTRGAGGLFIGLAAALYFFAPLSVVGTKIILDDYTPAGFDKALAGLNTAFTCASAGDESIISSESLTGPTFIENYEVAKGLFEDMESKVESYMYFFLIQGTLTTIVALITMFSGMRAIAKLAGADADLSALMRIV